MRLLLLIASILLVFWSCGSESKSEATQQTEAVSDTSQNTPLRESYKILRQEQPGNFQNFDLLIKPSEVKLVDLMMSVKMFKARNCQSMPCNGVTFWDDEKALKLYEDKQDDAKWRKKNWPFVCEHQIAYYNATVGELEMYPFMDFEYRRWGGKKKRPVSGSYDM